MKRVAIVAAVLALSGFTFFIDADDVAHDQAHAVCDQNGGYLWFDQYSWSYIGGGNYDNTFICDIDGELELFYEEFWCGACET